MSSDLTRRLVFPAAGIALGNLAALGLLIGLVGTSRAFSVGIHTLIEDYPAAVVATMSMTTILAVGLGRRIRTSRELFLVVACAIAADAVAAVAVTLVFDEMRNAASVALPRAFVTETVGGMQLLVLAAGATVGYARTVGVARRVPRDIARP